MTQDARPFATVPDDRLAEFVASATYGTVLVLATLSVVSVAEVSVGYGAELIAGVGVATWVAHIYAELLAGHVHRRRPLERGEVTHAIVAGSPILVSPLLPAVALLLGKLDAIPEATARSVAIMVAVAQLLGIGVVVAKVAPARKAGVWIFAGVTVGTGIAVVTLTTLLGH